MLGMTDIKKGRIIVIEGEPYVVVSAEFLRKQQRRPVVRSMLRHLMSGQTREHTFMQSDKVPEADVTRVSFQYLYRAGEAFVFMNQETFDQVELAAEVVGGAAVFLLEGQAVELVLFGGRPVALELPIKIERRVVSAPPGVRGDTSANVMKEVVIEGGATVKAPLFVKESDVIVIDTRTGAYVSKG